MKKLILISIILLIITPVQVESIERGISIYKTIPSDAENIVQSGIGLQMSLHRNSLFLYLSKDINSLRFAGQSGVDINLWSVGIGTQHKVGEYLTLSLDAGWYEPKFKEAGEPQDYYSSPFAEGLCRYLNDYLIPGNGDQESYPAWDYYTLDYQGAIGGKLSLAFKYPLIDKVFFEMITGYRYLKLLENVQGRDYSNGTDWAATNYWTVRYDRDFSSWMIGVAFVVMF